jgi:DNA polymerase-4
MAWGEDDTPVVVLHDTPPAKSLGHEHTFMQDVATPDEGLSLLLTLADRVAGDLRSEGYSGRRVMIKMRYSDFSSLTRQRMLGHPTQETRDVFRTARDLFLRNYCGGGIRLLGVTVGELVLTHGRSQIGLFPEDRRYSRYLETVDLVRQSYGHASLLPAGGMSDRQASIPHEGGGHATPEERHKSERHFSSARR